MSLDAYRKKRNFDTTPEPPGRVAEGAAGAHPTFMIHKHHARRLHYDLRLEIGGVLASWAIPQGPSTDPDKRRLAVETEDHPLEYGGFEGRIPDGQYGAGDALIWDRGVYDTIPPGQATAMRKKGHLDLLFLGDKLKGRWHLIRTGGKRKQDEDTPAREWLFFKAKDPDADAKCDLVVDRPESVVSGRRLTRGPGLANLRGKTGNPIALLVRMWPPAAITKIAHARLPDATRALFCPLPAGPRLLAAIANGKVALQSEAGRDLAGTNPDLVRTLSDIAAVECVLDGRLAPIFVPQDLLWLDGEDQRSRPLEERIELLRGLFPNAAPWLDRATPTKGRKGGQLWAKLRGSCYGDNESWYEVV